MAVQCSAVLRQHATHYRRAAAAAGKQMLAVGLVRSGADINNVQHHRPRDWDMFFLTCSMYETAVILLGARRPSRVIT